MRRLVLQMGMSLDGLVGRPGRHGAGGWGLAPEAPELKQWKLDTLHEAGMLVMGRATYEEMAEAWPTSSSDYAVPMNALPKVVFSQTLEHADWADSTIARGDLATEIADLKREPGGDMIVHGGASFVQSLSNLGLIDEYRLVIHPIALGDGVPLFKGLPASLHLHLTEARTFDGGAVTHVYSTQPANA